MLVAAKPAQLIDYAGSCQTSDGKFFGLANRPTSSAFVIYPGRHHTSGLVSRLCPGRLAGVESPGKPSANVTVSAFYDCTQVE